MPSRDLGNKEIVQKKMLQDELTNLKTLELKAELEKIKEAEAAKRRASWQEYLGKLEAEGKIDKEGHTRWDDLLQHADKCIHSEQNAYNDWRSAMMALLSLFSLMIKAAVNSRQIAFAKTGIGSAVEEALVNAKDFVVDNIRGKPRFDLPVLFHDVRIEEDKLKIELKLSDNTLDTQRLNGHFKELVNLWLDEHGYEESSEAGKYVKADATKTPLTNEILDELKADFKQFLEMGSELQYSEGPAPGR